MIKHCLKIFVITSLIGLVTLSIGCSSVSKSNVTSTTQETPWDGTVFITQEQMPDSIEFKLIGTVEAKARAGYKGVESLYPLLAAEAKKIGANAVINTKGGRKLSAFSWSAPYAKGTAIKVQNQESLKGITGNFY